MEKEKKPLAPIIKWAGGKEKELKYIIPNIPEHERYLEPFVGGGSVFMAMNGNEFLVNDFSSELISLYKNIAEQNKEFFSYIDDMNSSWKRSEDLFKESPELLEIYKEVRNETIDKPGLKKKIDEFCKEKTGLKNVAKLGDIDCSKIFIKELKANLNRKLNRMHVLEKEKHLLPEEDLYDNILTAIKSAVYMVYRNLYNQPGLKSNNELYCALFFFIRNYSYSGMFRYNASGEFNVPYGGIAYNSKTLDKKVEYYQSKELQEHFQKAKIFNLDFEDFLKKVQPTENDFIFLDPPYDSEFSTYAKNEFNREDQKRLADYLLTECKAKWLMIIKYTDFIFDLYNKNGIFIKEFDKEYLVSFMNRNDKKVTHLLITNYQI